jgi:hypothetical protein
MPLVALADPVAALVARLRSFSEISAMVTTADGYADEATAVERARPRISTAVQRFWKLPTAAILLRRRSGPPPDRDGRIRTSRFDLWYFGDGGRTNSPSRQEREAFALWRQASPALTPAQGVSDRFVAAGCLVYGIDDEADPFPYDDRDTGWRVVVGPILVRWSEVPVT